MTPSFKALISSTVLVLASTTAFSALAQTPGAPATPASGARTKGQGMKALDTNKEGQLSRDELKAYRKAHRNERKRESKGSVKN